MRLKKSLSFLLFIRVMEPASKS